MLYKLRDFVLLGARIRAGMGGEEELINLCVKLADQGATLQDSAPLMDESLKHLQIWMFENHTKH